MMHVYNIHSTDPGLTALYLSLYMATILVVAVALFAAIAGRRRRVTPIYLGGEPEELVANPTPNPIHLYWGFVKKYCAGVYRVVREKTHTGNLQDWVRLMASWYGLLLLIALVLGAVYVWGGG